MDFKNKKRRVYICAGVIVCMVGIFISYMYTQNNRTSYEVALYKEDRERGVISSIDYENMYFTLRYQSRYQNLLTGVFKIYFDEEIAVKKVSLFQQNGVTYATGNPTPYSIYDIKVGNFVYVEYEIIPGKKILLASYILYGIPFLIL